LQTLAVLTDLTAHTHTVHEGVVPRALHTSPLLGAPRDFEPHESNPIEHHVYVSPRSTKVVPSRVVCVAPMILCLNGGATGLKIPPGAHLWIDAISFTALVSKPLLH